MKIVPTSIEEQINRVDRQRSLYIGMTFGWFLGSMVFQFVLWGVIGAVAAVAATAFPTHYKKGS